MMFKHLISYITRINLLIQPCIFEWAHQLQKKGIVFLVNEMLDAS